MKTPFTPPTDPTVAVFCGRNYGARKDYFQSMALETGRVLAEAGFGVATGGGAGMMNDVNRGAHEVGGHVHVIQIEFEEDQSPYFSRKEMFTDLRLRQQRLLQLATGGLIVLPGGLGTLYEAIEVLTFKAKYNYHPVPLVFVDKDFYAPVETFLNTAQKEGFILKAIADLSVTVATPADAVMVLTDFHKKKAETGENIPSISA